MKYAFMTFSCPELNLRDVLDLAKQTGYDGVEPRITADHKQGKEIDIDASTRAEIRETVADSGISLA